MLVTGMGKEMYTKPDISGGQASKHTDRQADRWTDGQTDGKTEKQSVTLSVHMSVTGMGKEMYMKPGLSGRQAGKQTQTDR